MITLEEAKKQTAEKLRDFGYDEEIINKTIDSFISIISDNKVLARTNAGNIEIFL